MQNETIRFQVYRPAAVLRVAGDDTFTFLQGQFTNELRQVAGSVAYGLWLNQKGRVLADSQALRLGEKEFVLISIFSLATGIQKRLEDYIISDDVAVTDETAAFAGLTLWGSGCGERLRGVLGSLPEGGKFIEDGKGWVFAGRRSSAENYEIVGPESRLAELRESLRSMGCVEAGIDEAEVARLLTGIPAVPADIGPSDLPNEGALDLTAISYTKGCYLGQEVMARIKNLGQVRRHLRVVQGPGGVPKPGTGLFQAGKKLGEIRSGTSFAGGFIAMAMLTKLGLSEDAGLAFSADGSEAAKIRPHG